MTTEATCTSCEAPIEWVRTTKGSRMPLDVGLYDDGNIDVVDGVAHVVHLPDDPGRLPRRRSHFASCPHADAHRRRR
jgi:hypothetical protein